MLIWLLLLNSLLLGADGGYSYPVGADSQQVFYVYQKSLSDLELWSYDLERTSVKKCLDWRFIPAGFKLLQDHSGFSFIDSGRLRLKKFLKRSPKTIDFDQPVHGVSEINWLDGRICYFSAKRMDHWVIFYGDLTDEKLHCVYQLPQSDCLSPCIIDGQLFCIERHGSDRSVKITHQPVPSIANDTPPLSSSVQPVADCGYAQVFHLQMLSATLGFYLEHMPYIHEKTPFVTLVCHKLQLNYTTQAWETRRLFKFRILKDCLFGAKRLYESIIPFLPRAQKTRLYFADIKQNSKGECKSSIRCFDFTNGKIVKILNSPPNKILFAPLEVGRKIFYGELVNDEGYNPADISALYVDLNAL